MHRASGDADELLGGEKNEEKFNENSKPLNDDPNDLSESAPNAAGNAASAINNQPKPILPPALSPTPRKSERERKNIDYSNLNKGARDSDDDDSSYNDRLAGG